MCAYCPIKTSNRLPQKARTRSALRPEPPTSPVRVRGAHRRLGANRLDRAADEVVTRACVRYYNRTYVRGGGVAGGAAGRRGAARRALRGAARPGDRAPAGAGRDAAARRGRPGRARRRGPRRGPGRLGAVRPLGGGAAGGRGGRGGRAGAGGPRRLRPRARAGRAARLRRLAAPTWTWPGRCAGGSRRPARRCAEGEISHTHARILFEETRELDDPATAAVTTRVLGRGPRRTPAEFGAAVRRAVIRSDPVRAELAAARASAQRMVAKRALPDAQAALFVTGPATAVQTIWTAPDAHAARPDTPGPGADQAGADGRTLDQRRFDALVTLCRAALGERPPGRPVPPTVYLFADLATWTGLADDPVHLDGYGPVPPGVARAHLTDARWRALVTDTVTGAALAV